MSALRSKADAQIARIDFVRRVFWPYATIGNRCLYGEKRAPATIPIAWLVSAPSSLPPDLILEVTSTFPSNYATSAYGRKQPFGLSLNGYV